MMNQKNRTAVINFQIQFAPNLAISVSSLWDSSAGEPAPTLGPVNGYWGAGLAANITSTKNWR